VLALGSAALALTAAVVAVGVLMVMVVFVGVRMVMAVTGNMIVMDMHNRNSF